MKIEIMKSKPDLSDEEIRGYMDFNDLVKRRELAMKKDAAIKKLKIGSFFVSLVVVSGLIFYFSRTQTEVNLSPVEKTSSHFPGVPQPRGNPSIKVDPDAARSPEKSAATKNTVHTKTSDQASRRVGPKEVQPEE